MTCHIRGLAVPNDLYRLDSYLDEGGCKEAGQKLLSAMTAPADW
jgi:hypothetical protein